MMKVITTREMTRQAKTYFELAKEERVAVKRGQEFVNLIVTDKPDTKFFTDEWLDEFMKIPMEYRCNPFDISPSGDMFWADKRNVEKLEESLAKAEEDIKAGRVKRINGVEELNKFLDSL